MAQPRTTFDETELLRLLQLAGADDYTGAIAYCEEALAAGASPRFWRRQLAYCLFLDERGPVENQTRDEARRALGRPEGALFSQ